MKSMTGFGFCRNEGNQSYILIDIKSYNNRYLDIQVNLPPYLNPLEPRLIEYLSSRIRRGKVEVLIKIMEYEEETTVFLDEKRVEAYVEAFRRLIERVGVKDQVRLSHLLRIEGIFKTRTKWDTERYWELIRGPLEIAFRDFDSFRIREGENIRQDLVSQLEIIESGLNRIEEYKTDLKEVILGTLRRRFHELLGNEIDENRIFAETALLLLKFDINEELVRMKSHLSDFFAIMKSGKGIGKKLDFICQELNREINTISSKSVQIEIHSSVVKVKDAIERIREQLRNVE